MKHTLFLSFISATALAVPTITLENAPSGTVVPPTDGGSAAYLEAAKLRFDVIVIPDGIDDWAPRVAASGPSPEAQPQLLFQPDAGETRFSYELNMSAALPGEYTISAHTHGPNQQELYATAVFVWRYVPGEPVLHVNVKDGDTVGDRFWLWSSCDSCNGLSAPPQGWHKLTDAVSDDGTAAFRRESDGTYALTFQVYRLDNAYQPPVVIRLKRGTANVAPHADPPVTSSSCASTGGLLPLLAVLWLWRRRGALALSIALVGCQVAPVEVVSPGSGPENAEPLWPAHVGWSLSVDTGNTRHITDRWTGAKGETFLLQSAGSSGSADAQTFVEDAQGIYFAGSERIGALEKPLLLVPAKVKLGQVWRVRAKLPRPPRFDDSLAETLSDSDVWQFSVVSNEVTPTPWGKRRLWVIEVVGPPAASLEAPPRLRATYALLEGIGPLTQLPDVGWPTLWLPSIDEQLSASYTWSLPGAKKPDEAGLPTATLGTPLFESSEFVAHDLSLILTPGQERLRVDGLTQSFSNTGGFGPDGNTHGVTGYYATGSARCFDVSGGGFQALSTDTQQPGCVHGTAGVVTSTGQLLVARGQNPLGFASEFSPINNLDLRITGLGLAPDDGVVISARSNSGAAVVGGDDVLPATAVNIGAASGCDGIASGLLEWRQDHFDTLCRSVGSDGNVIAVTSGNHTLPMYESLNYRVAPAERRVTMVTAHGLLKSLEWDASGLHVKQLGRVVPPEGVRLRGAVQLDANTWFIVGEKGSSWIPLFTSDAVTGEDGISPYEETQGPGTMQLWKVTLTPTPRDEAPSPETLTIGNYPSGNELQICWAGDAKTLSLSFSGAAAVTPALRDISGLPAPLCGAVPPVTPVDGAWSITASAPSGAFSVLRTLPH